jgi:hypothetical protein
MQKYGFNESEIMEFLLRIEIFFPLVGLYAWHAAGRDRPGLFVYMLYSPSATSIGCQKSDRENRIGISAKQKSYRLVAFLSAPIIDESCSYNSMIEYKIIKKIKD